MEESKKNEAEVVVPRRRKKVPPRDKTPDPSLRINRLSKCSDSENESSKPGDDKTSSDHKRKILDKRNKTILQRRSLSNPRVIDNQQQSELFELLRAAKRSLSSPREPFEDKLQSSGKSSVPNLTHESKILSKSKQVRKNVNASKAGGSKVAEAAVTEKQIDKVDKIEIDNDAYESSTESCSISETENLPSTQVEPTISKTEIIEKVEPKLPVIKPQPAKQAKPAKKDINNKSSYLQLIRDARLLWRNFKQVNNTECRKIHCLKNKCISDLIAMMIFCGCGGMIFKFTEGAFENFYKCGVKRVKRDFIDQLWQTSMHMR